jgi:hypothetical protein
MLDSAHAQNQFTLLKKKQLKTHHQMGGDGGGGEKYLAFLQN